MCPSASGPDDPSVSVVVPVYDQPNLLHEALESIAAQTFVDYEVLVVDDASPIDFESIVDSFDDRFRLLTHDVNQGAGAARNTGFERSRGEYVAFLDADDVWRPRKLEAQHAVFESEGDDLGLVYTGFVQYEVDGSKWVHQPSACGEIYVQELERDRIHPTSTVMVRRDALSRADGFDPSLPSRQDYDLWLRITRHYTVDYVDDVLVEKREQSDSISMDFDRRIQGDLAVLAKVRSYLDDLDVDRWTRARIVSYHYQLIGRDYESNGERVAALHYLALAIARYPLRPVSWAIFAIALFGIDRNGPIISELKGLIR